MSWQISDYLSAAILNHCYRNTAITPPTTIYLALFTDDPGRDGSGTEVTGGSYVRMAIAFDAPANDTLLSSAAVTFPVATAIWGSISHVALYDAVSGGNLYSLSVLPSVVSIVVDQQLEFDTSTISVNIVVAGA